MRMEDEAAVALPSVLSQFDDLVKAHATEVEKLQQELESAKAALDAANLRIQALEQQEQ